MNITVSNAYANNLKHISVQIPLNKVTAITGVSGSGKSTLLKDIISAYSYKNYSRVASKTVRNTIADQPDVYVDSIDCLPASILIDVRSSVSSPLSTVSTLSGIHDVIRTLFVNYGIVRCPCCSKEVTRDYSLVELLRADLRVDDKIDDALSFVNNNGNLDRIEYYDKNGIITKDARKRSLATIWFTLNKITEKIIHDFNLKYSCRVLACREREQLTYDLQREMECNYCHTIMPSLSKSRLSFNTKYTDGGGSCRCCNGHGVIARIQPSKVFVDRKKALFDGASNFVTRKGIKYTTVTEKFLEAACKHFEIDSSLPLEELPEDKIDLLLFGSTDTISFSDRVGGKKTLVFRGINDYLSESYYSGKGKPNLPLLFDDEICPDCKGTRIDKEIDCFYLFGKQLGEILNMSFAELGVWLRSKRRTESLQEYGYLDQIISEIDVFEQLSCSHISLYRASNTLSGGELQRIRISALLNSNVHGICYLLDEPSSGLHYSDIEKLGSLFRSITDRNNTIIMVEHNLKLLQYCDYIIDMGPLGGKNGGEVLFSDTIDKVRDYDTNTAKVLMSQEKDAPILEPAQPQDDFLNFDNLTANNLKNVSVRFPRNMMTVVCGVSGSGKSTFVRKVVYSATSVCPRKYGFESVEYFGQAGRTVSSLSTVATLLNLSTYIAQEFEKVSGCKKSVFMPSSNDGKCSCCGGTGRIFSSENEIVGICDQCNGYGYQSDVLSFLVDGLNIYDIYNTDLSLLSKTLKNKRIVDVAETASLLGIGYLTLSRASKTLSKGELQRVSLINVITGRIRDNLIILDEPSKGLHNADASKLVRALRETTRLGNTLLVVEHNPSIIRYADYLIEFGGTGATGGYVLFQGPPNSLCATPTSEALHDLVKLSPRKEDRHSPRIELRDDGESVDYLPHKLYYASGKEEILTKIARQSQNDFLSVVIPNNAMFARTEEQLTDVSVPVIFAVDFNERIKYDVSVCEALGIDSLLKRIAAAENEDQFSRFVFDISSVTGKCSLCNGRGAIAAVDESNFVRDGEITPECKKFLKNSTNYSKVIKLLKRNKLDISKPLKTLSGEEHKTLFWGHDTLLTDGDACEFWQGIIPCFMEYHKYYPKDVGETIYSMKQSIQCPLCNGTRLKPRFSHISCGGVSYNNWMMDSVDKLCSSIQGMNGKEYDDLRNRLEGLLSLNLGTVRLSDEIAALDSVTAGKIKFLSLFYNRIYDLGIVIKNANSLAKQEYETLEKMAMHLSKTNTIWIV